ncbi:hypothetical protein ACFV5G_08090 [Streptomyces sp. NPDC059766]|uniref:hypothetical protein n=1 Tax=Streptomyces sp. NPDC059766 TaxID=3346940 RepID=UPI00365AEE5D
MAMVRDQGGLRQGSRPGLPRNRLNRKHTGLKDLCYALVKARVPLPEVACEAAWARAAKQQDLARVRAERDDLRNQTQLPARIVQVLEIGKGRLKEKTRTLEGQPADRAGDPDPTRRCRS